MTDADSMSVDDMCNGEACPGHSGTTTMVV